MFAVAVLMATAASAQSVVTGTVVDKENDPIVGASVIVKGTPTGTTADIDGKFSINAKPSDVLSISAVGFKPVEIPVNNQKNINVVLDENAEVLDEIVVIGYGTSTRKEVTGSVSSIKKEDLNQGSFPNAMGLLQGKVAGLQIVNSNGADPTATYQILLRGTNTLSAGQGPLVIIDGVAGQDIRNINPDDVESVDVLKDGSAAAIYGTRGSNGVILITTRRAREGRAEVNYQGLFTIGTVSRRAEPLTADWFNYVIDKYRPALNASQYGHDTDWFDVITRTPMSMKHTVSLSGGTANFSHYTSVNYEKAAGVQKNNDYEKMAARTNIRQTMLQGWVNLDLNLFINHRKYNPANRSAFEQAFIHNPTEPVYDHANEAAGGYFTVPAMEYYNPLAMINERRAQTINNNFGGNARVTLNIKPVEGLKWDAFLAMSREVNESKTYYTHYYPSKLGTDGQAEQSNYKNNNTQFETTIQYIRHFNVHSLQALLGYTYEQSYENSAAMSNQGFDFDDFGWDNMGVGTGLLNGKASISSSAQSHKYIGFFGRVMYNYNEKYLASVSLRRDGSSRFGANHKWGWFPAFSLGWRMTREAFMQDIDWLNELKIRGGYGVTGNQDFSNYKSLILMGVAGMFWYNGQWVNTYQPVSNPNPDLQWEKKKEFNIGFESDMFNGRLGVTFDYYRRVTDNLLYNYSVPTPPYIYDNLFTNVGKISNQGIELTLTGIPVQTRNFQWTSTYILAHNTNKLDKFTNEEFQNGTYKVGWSSGGKCYVQRLIEGQSLGTFYGPVFLGTDTDGRDVLLGEGADGTVPEEQWVPLGTAYPKVTMSWNNTFMWKNWDLNFTLRASLGGKILNEMALRYANLDAIGINNISNKWLDDQGHTELGVKYSSKYVEDGSYLKMDNVSLGYTFRFHNRFVKMLRLSFTAQNVFTITKYKGVDPEVGITGLTPGLEGVSYYPRTTTFTFGVNASF